MRLALLFIVCLVVLSCNTKEEIMSELEKTSFDNPPSWAYDAIWYELSVERFRNGDTSNDPTKEDIIGSYPGFVPEGWKVTPWTHDWYEPDSYFENAKTQKDYYGNKLNNFTSFAQMRRYGGDLKGVLDKVSYLDSLGVTALYFRPINDAPSLHKYDARNWRHVDVNFGPDPQEDKALIESEVPDDPSTWVQTKGDKLFLEILDSCHQLGMKVIMDYSWNHTGNTFWAWKDVVKNQKKSKYKDWYWIDEWDDPDTKENEFEYHGWLGVRTLPEIRETQKQDLSVELKSFEGNVYSAEAKQHIFNVAKKWLDPNQDGDPSDGVDGFRLDVAAEMPIDFWRDFRRLVRDINPNTYLLGEIWWQEFPDKLLDPQPFLQGDVFDAVMNYRWYRSVRHFFNESPKAISKSELVDSLTRFSSNIKDNNNAAMMNYTGGYDTPRILTSLYNKNKYKYQCKVHESHDYKINKPDQKTFQTLRLLLTQQYSYIGAPHIYAGDEMGMWGADDPSCRKPLIWPDYNFNKEKAHPLGHNKAIDSVEFDHELFNFHRKMISIRKTNPVLISGDIEFLDVDANRQLLAYRRFDTQSEVVALFNHLDEDMAVNIPIQYKHTYKNLITNMSYESKDKQIEISVPPRTALLLSSQ